MAISPELNGFTNENDFVQRFLVPLFGRIGLGIVINHHGKSEAGMDLIVGEIDRFGHVRYHGVQAKFQASISKGDSHGLVQDATEAFAAEFRHPQTGANHWISTFYAVNGGTISDEARGLFFAQLRSRHGDNVRLLEGRDLVALDRSATVRSEGTRERLQALLLESRSIVAALDKLIPYLTEIVNGDGNGVVYPPIRLRLVAVESWLAQPVGISTLPVHVIEELHSLASAFNRSLDEAGSSPLHTVVSIKVPAQKALYVAAKAQSDATELESAVAALLAGLGPFATL